MLQINNIYKSFGGINVLNGVSIDVLDGEIYGLVGSNGAGKTTLLNVIGGLLRPNVGDIRVSGKDVRAINTVPNVIGYVQDLSIAFEFMTAREYMKYLTDCSSLTKEISEKRIAQLAEMFGLADNLDKRVRLYSRGMKQRLSIACALLGNPKVVVMDEPTSMLDTEAKDELKGIFQKMKNSGKSIIISTNSLWDIENYCDKVGLLVKGRIKFESTIESIRATQKEGMEIVVENGMEQKLAKLFCDTGIATISGKDGAFQITSPDKNFDELYQILKNSEVKFISVSKYLPSFKDLFFKEARK